MMHADEDWLATEGVISKYMATVATLIFGLAYSIWPFQSEPFQSRDISAWPFLCGEISVKTFPSRQTTDNLCLMKWLYRQANITLTGVVPNPFSRVMIAIKFEW